MTSEERGQSLRRALLQVRQARKSLSNAEERLGRMIKGDVDEAVLASQRKKINERKLELERAYGKHHPTLSKNAKRRMVDQDDQYEALENELSRALAHNGMLVRHQREKVS